MLNISVQTCSQRLCQDSLVLSMFAWLTSCVCMPTLCNMQIGSKVKVQLRQTGISLVLQQIFDYILQVFQVCLTWVESADRRCVVSLKLAGGGAASTGGRTLGGAVASSLLVTSETGNQTDQWRRWWGAKFDLQCWCCWLFLNYIGSE